MFAMLLPPRPAFDLHEINVMTDRDEYRLPQALTIRKKKEGSEAAHYALRRGQYSNAYTPGRMLGPFANKFTSEREWPFWKFERVRDRIVNEVTTGRPRYRFVHSDCR